MSEIMKENGIQIFESEEFGKIRVVERDGEPWFVAADVCKALEIGNPSQAISRLDEDEKVTLTTNEGHSGKVGGAQMLSAISEPGLYSIILTSRKSEAKQFKRWVTHEVIPSIRKHGGYIHGQEELTPSELMAKALLVAQKTIEEREQRISALETVLEKQKPKVEFADQVSNTKNLTNMGKMAKLLNDKGIEIGRNRLLEFLREEKILMSDNVPYQQYIDQGYFVVKETVKDMGKWQKTLQTTLVTGKGQQFVCKKVMNGFVS